ncbi:hypothetical protein KY284_001306 [Solanum tuberosum]|nr:hypothetical protein KY284_001306 [Solanum tuberosum]
MLSANLEGFETELNILCADVDALGTTYTIAPPSSSPTKTGDKGTHTEADMDKGAEERNRKGERRAIERD